MSFINKKNASKITRAFSLVLLFFTTVCAQVEIKLAPWGDLDKFVELNRSVSYKDWKPVFSKAHPDLSEKEIDKMIEDDLGRDEVFFSSAITLIEDFRLLGAYNSENNTLIAFLLLHKKTKDLAEIELLMVDSEYRNQGVGKRLVLQVLNLDLFPGITLYEAIWLAPERRCVGHKLYEACGFVQVKPRIGEVNSYGMPYTDQYVHYEYSID